MRTVRSGLMLTLGVTLLASCQGSPSQSAKGRGAPSAKLLGLRAPSSHYVEATFNGPVTSAYAEPSKYAISGPDGTTLTVQSALVDGSQLTLVTGAQQNVQYQLNASADLGIGAMGFVGTSTSEPYVQSAQSLSATSILVTFSAPMDRQLAENVAYYNVADPNGDKDVNIQIMAAKLNDDLSSVVLTTTPQENVLYTLRVTNAKSRFTCDDGRSTVLTDAVQGVKCLPEFLGLDSMANPSGVHVTARTAIDTAARMNPNASGQPGDVSTTPAGIGVRTSTCTGNPCSTANPSGGDEELIFTFDAPVRADTVVFRLEQFAPSALTIFLSSTATTNFDYTISGSDVVRAATGLDGDVRFSTFTTLPPNLMIDQVKLRAVEKHSCLAMLCVMDGRRVDPTRNLANFYGTPVVDTTGPTVVSARSTSPTTVLVTFSEPLNSAAADPVHFSISPTLVVTAAVATELETQMILTTTKQAPNDPYTLTVSDVQDRAGNTLAPNPQTASFRGVNGDLFLASAVSLDTAHLLLTFSQPMDPATTQNVAFYHIADPDTDVDVDIRVTGAVASADGRTVTLTTTPQGNLKYEVIATNIKVAGDDFYIDPARNSAVFWGIPPNDTVGPTLVSAVSVGATTLVLTFSEPLKVEAADPTNFTITPTLTVIGASIGAHDTQITLTTAPQTAGGAYTVLVSWKRI